MSGEIFPKYINEQLIPNEDKYSDFFQYAFPEVKENIIPRNPLNSQTQQERNLVSVSNFENLVPERRSYHDRANFVFTLGALAVVCALEPPSPLDAVAIEEARSIQEHDKSLRAVQANLDGSLEARLAEQLATARANLGLDRSEE